jgi:hypothetical protein
MAHDRRVDDEPWAWLAAVTGDELDRDWERVRARMTVSFAHQGTDASQRRGDLVFYCGADSGALAGVAEIAETSESSRQTVLPQLVLDRSQAPSIADAGVERPERHTRLDRDAYSRLRAAVLSAAVPLSDTFGETGATASASMATDAGTAAWLAAVPDDDLDRDWQRVMERVAVTLDASTVPTLQRVGDLVVYCAAQTGALAGVGQVVGEPLATDGDATRRRLKILPRLLLDRDRAPSVSEAGMSPRRLQTRLDPEPYGRLRELVISAALPL